MRRLPRGSAVVIAAIAAFILLGLVLFSAPGHDDSHITYWAAHTLKEHGQILNYNGERVEQSSSLAHVLLLALLGAVTRVSLPTLGPLTLPGPPLRFFGDGGAEVTRRDHVAPPTLDQHGASIRAWLEGPE